MKNKNYCSENKTLWGGIHLFRKKNSEHNPSGGASFLIKDMKSKTHLLPHHISLDSNINKKNNTSLLLKTEVPLFLPKHPISLF